MSTIFKVAHKKNMIKRNVRNQVPIHLQFIEKLFSVSTFHVSF